MYKYILTFFSDKSHESFFSNISVYDTLESAKYSEEQWVNDLSKIDIDLKKAFDTAYESIKLNNHDMIETSLRAIVNLWKKYPIWYNQFLLEDDNCKFRIDKVIYIPDDSQ